MCRVDVKGGAVKRLKSFEIRGFQTLDFPRDCVSGGYNARKPLILCSWKQINVFKMDRVELWHQKLIVYLFFMVAVCSFLLSIVAPELKSHDT